MKNITTILFLLFVLTQELFCQDVINTLDGREIEATIVEIEQNNIKYKKYDQPNGPIRNIEIEYIDFIQYEDGSIERFTKIGTSSPIINNADQDQLNLEYINLKLEKARSIKSTGSIMIGLGSLGSIIGFVALLSENSPSYAGPLLLGSLGIGYGGGVIVWAVGATREEYFLDRKSQLTLIVAPTNTLHNNPTNTQILSYSDLSIGVRVMF